MLVSVNSAAKPAPATTIRRFGLVLGGTALLTACAAPAPIPPPPPPAPTSEAPVCPEPGVAITTGEVDGAMGLRALGIVLTNCGTRDYTANGYPVVRVLDEDRQPLGITVGEGSAPVSAPDSYDVPPQPVTLRPGEQVTARVLWRNTVTESTVPGVVGRYLEIAPASAEPAQIVAPRGGIDLGNTGRLAVNPWAARA
jgi:hypothetical protein